MSKKQFVIGSGDLSPRFSYKNAKAELGPIADYLISLSDKPKPRISYIGTAAGDSSLWIDRFYEACKGKDLEPGHLQLFKKPNHKDVREFLLQQDIIWVAGGSTANLLAVWEVHGLMAIMQEAQANGTILSGYSAGCVCWSQGGTTDSFGDTPQLLVNEKSLLPYSMCVHYDIEPKRKPLYRRLVKKGKLSAGYATEEGVAIHFIDGKPYKIIADRPGKFAYHVYKAEDGSVVEEKLEPIVIN